MTFASLLRQYRLGAALSQEALAERAGLSARAISDLESQPGRTPYRSTLEALEQALGLSNEERSSFEAAVVRHRHPRGAQEPADALPSRRIQPPPTALLGRDAELAGILDLLGTEPIRLLTLVGPAGVGKTRLALEAGRQAAPRFPHGATFIDLTRVRSPDLVFRTVAESLHLQDAASTGVVERLRAYLGGRTLLLILDNFEHVLPAAAQFPGLLGDCPGVTLLVTSRRSLQLRWERVFYVPPLAVVDPAMLPPLPQLQAVPSVALFVERAQAVSADFALSNDNARAVAELCLHLDGLPLAIELAAARTPVLSPAMMLNRLAERFSLLRWDAQDLPERQRTLGSAIAWSDELLSATERMIFQSLGVFSSAFGLEAAVAVVEDDEPDAVSVLDGLAALVARSLVVREETTAAEPRFRLLESTREYARERLREEGRLEAVSRAHARYFLDVAERADPALRGPEQRQWFARLEQEHESLRAALAHLATKEDGHDQLRLAAALWYFWWIRGYLAEGREHLEASLRHCEQAPAPLRLNALIGLGVILLSQVNAEPGPVLDAALALAEDVGDAASVSEALANRGLLELWRGGWKRSIELLRSAETVSSEAADARGKAYAVVHRGIAAVFSGDLALGEALLEEARRTYEELEDECNALQTAAWQAFVISERGDLGRAAELLGTVLAADCLHADPRLLFHCADLIVWMAQDLGEAEAMARLVGAQETLNRITGFAYSAWSAKRVNIATTAIRARLPAPTFDAARLAGHALTAEGLIAELRRVVDGLQHSSPKSKAQVRAPNQRLS